MLGLWTHARAALSILLLAATAGVAAPPTREQCEAAHPAAWGRPGKDVVWLPTSDAVVLAMLTMAQVTPQDVVLDLGAGDGKIAIAAAREPFGARAVGVEYDPELVSRATCLVQAEGLGERVRVVQGDIFEEDFGAASVVTLYLLPQLNRCVRHRLLALEPGTRVVSHQYGMADWKPERTVTIQGRDVHRWVVPARVGAVWDFEDSQGAAFTIELRQTFDVLEGDVLRAGARTGLDSASLRGRELRFTYGEANAATRFSGTVRGHEVTGVLSTGTTARTAVGRRRGEPRSAPWAEMPPDCRRYYDR